MSEEPGRNPDCFGRNRRASAGEATRTRAAGGGTERAEVPEEKSEEGRRVAARGTQVHAAQWSSVPGRRESTERAEGVRKKVQKCRQAGTNLEM